MKKIVSILLTVAMLATLFAVVAVPASAAEATSYASLYSGNMDTSWYNKDDIKEEYHLTSADQLAGLSYLVGWEFVQFDGVTIYLDTDIVWNTGVFSMDDLGNPLYNDKVIDTADINAHKAGDEVIKFWEPIGDREQKPGNKPSAIGQFYGSFDGQGHTISGLYVNDGNKGYAGLFTVFCGKELKNLSIINSYISGDSRNGSFAGFVYNAYECGENKDIVGSKFSNLYSNAYVVSTCGISGNNPRSGGFVGMIRPNKIVDGQDPVAKGTLTVFENCWFDGTMVWYDSLVLRSAGIIGVAALDSTTNKSPQNQLVIENTLMTGAFYNYGKTDIENGSTSGTSFSSILSEIYKGRVTVKNVIAAMKDTNFTTDKFVYETTDANGNKTVTSGRTTVGRVASDPSEVIYENVFDKELGIFEDSPEWYEIAEAERDYVSVKGEAQKDKNLALALVALSANPAFDLSDLNAPALKGVKTTCDPVNPEDLNPEPPVTEPPVVETDPPVVETDPPVVETDPPVVDTDPTDPADPVVTTPQVTTPTTQPTEEKGCGSMNVAVVAAIAVIAIGSAVIVFKKK